MQHIKHFMCYFKMTYCTSRACIWLCVCVTFADVTATANEGKLQTYSIIDLKIMMLKITLYQYKRKGINIENFLKDKYKK